MRHSITTLFIVVAFPSFAQIVELKHAEHFIVIGTARVDGNKIAELNYNVAPTNDTLYVLVYKDLEQQNFDNIPFYNIEITLETLYKVCKSAFENENKKNKRFVKSFRLSDEDWSVKYHNLAGSDRIWIDNPKGHFELDENGLDNLFGKR